MSLLFYTAANKKYEHFVPLYLYSVLRSNPSAGVEVGLENPTQYKRENSEVVRLLSEEFGRRFAFTQVDFEGILPSAARFITEPTLADQYENVYIGDIDILIFDEGIEQRHLENMARHNAPFSNIIRQVEVTEGDKPRLTGLHFAPIDLQYPLPDLDGLDFSSDNSLRGADEHVLYQIMKRKGEMVSRDMDYRPEHGIHIRSHSYPFGKRVDGKRPELSFDALSVGGQRLPWRGIENNEYRESFLTMLNDPAFQELYFHLDIKSKNLLLVLENICRERFGEFEAEAKRYILTESNDEILTRRFFEVADQDGLLSAATRALRYIAQR